MKQICKKLLIILMAVIMSVSALGLSSCHYFSFGLDGYELGDDSTVYSQGGWVVEKGEYVYFINGIYSIEYDEDGNEVDVERDNTYGKVVRGALMRIKKSEIKNSSYSEAKGEIVVPLLIATGGLYIYGDYVYYATPTTAKNLEGETESNYLDFKSSRLDGKKTMSDYYFRGTETTTFRYVEVDGVVYCLHTDIGTDGSDLYSYNTKTREDNLLVRDMRAQVFHKTDLSDPYVYYSMKVTDGIDQKNYVEEEYRQIYRVRADATCDINAKQASYTVTDGRGAYEYEYDFDEKSLKKLSEDNDEYTFKANDLRTYPYVNLGELVLDGIGSGNEKTQYNHDTGTPYTPDGYYYSLMGYENGGLYYKRQYVSESAATGESGRLYYLPESACDKSSWNAVTGNATGESGDENELISNNLTNDPTELAFYIKEDGTHCYLVSGNLVVTRVETDGNGGIAEEVIIARNGGATSFVGFDNSGIYKYVYFTASEFLYRAVYDSEEAGYDGNEEAYYHALAGNDKYKVVSVKKLGHQFEQFDPEVVNGYAYFIDITLIAEKDINAAMAVSLQNSNGQLMNNQEIKEWNEEQETTVKILERTAEISTAFENAIFYYFYTGDETLFWDTIKELAEDDDFYKDYNQYSLFSRDEQEGFRAYVEKRDFTKGKITLKFSEMVRNTRSEAYNQIGLLPPDDEDNEEAENWTSLWKSYYFNVPVEEDAVLQVWQWVLIGIAIGVGVVGIACGITIPLVLRHKKKAAQAPAVLKRKKYKVDMNYDKDVDVYAVDEPVEEKADEPVEESTAEDAVEETVTSETEESVEETAEKSEEE